MARLSVISFLSVAKAKTSIWCWVARGGLRLQSVFLSLLTVLNDDNSTIISLTPPLLRISAFLAVSHSSENSGGVGAVGFV